ncbi:MAG: hypothetical protein RSB34_05060, partial [Muribaculaceae bacterium]
LVVLFIFSFLYIFTEKFKYTFIILIVCVEVVLCAYFDENNPELKLPCKGNKYDNRRDASRIDF